MKRLPEPDHDGYFVYIALCRDKTLYTGWARNIKKRFLVHNKGQGAKYTRARLPVKLVFHREFSSQKKAMAFEYQIKKLSRTDKIKMIEQESASWKKEKN